MATPKKQSRPRIDAIKRHILAGSYDDELWEIKAAIDERNRRRQEAVQKLVEEVYGEGYKVFSETERPKENPFIKKHMGRDLAPGEVLPGASPHVQAVDADTPAVGDDLDGPDFESRSPIIGPYIPEEADLPQADETVATETP